MGFPGEQRMMSFVPPLAANTRTPPRASGGYLPGHYRGAPRIGVGVPYEVTP